MIPPTWSGNTTIFCDFEDPDYAAFFSQAVEAVEAYEAGRMTAADAANRIFDLANHYEFAVPIRKDALVRAHWIKEEDQLPGKRLGIYPSWLSLGADHPADA